MDEERFLISTSLLKSMIALIDYGAGNLKSVSKALDYLGAKHTITNSPEKILSAKKIILPGVGNFGEVMDMLGKNKLDLAIKEFISSGKPYLGICVGLQVLFESSEESPKTKGLGIFKGKVIKLRTKEKIPEIGWNSISIKKQSKLLKGIKDNSYFYFVHSYCCSPSENGIILTTTEYGTEFTSAVEKANIFAVQFHPEKSGEIGLKVLKNFLEI